MSWDRTNLVFSLPMASWSNGNAPASYNVGTVPSVAGAWQACTLTNMGAGYGFVNPGAGLGHLNFDAVNDLVDFNKILQFTNASKFTIEFKLNVVTINDYQGLIASFLTGDTTGLRCYITNFTDANYNQIAFTIATGGHGVITSTRITNGDRTVHCVKDGASMKVYIDGVECSYAYDIGYSKGTVTCDRALWLGNELLLAARSYNGKMYTVNYYDDAISQARITANAALGNDMGEVANNVGDVLTIAGGSPIPLFSRKLIQRN